MLGAFGWGVLAASSLVLGAVAALRFQISLRTIGCVMGFGAGVLISAVSFDLVQKAIETSAGHGATIGGLLAGCLTFFVGDLLIERLGGGQRKRATGASAEGDPLGIVLGTVLDGIPESLVIGLTFHEGGAIGAAYLVAVFVSNVPEAISSTVGLTARGWRHMRILLMWTGIVAVSGVASAVGYNLFARSSDEVVAFVLAFAGGAVLTMLAETMMPEAYLNGGKVVGVLTTLGFTLAFALEQLD